MRRHIKERYARVFGHYTQAHFRHTIHYSIKTPTTSKNCIYLRGVSENAHHTDSVQVWTMPERNKFKSIDPLCWLNHIDSFAPINCAFKAIFSATEKPTNRSTLKQHWPMALNYILRATQNLLFINSGKRGGRLVLGITRLNITAFFYCHAL